MNSKILNTIQILLTVALVVFIVLKAGDFLHQVDWQLIVLNWPSVLLSSVVFSFGYVALAKHWDMVTKLITSKTGKNQWLAFFASQPYKYLPTSIFTFSSRATFAKKIGMGFRDSTEAQVVENINLIGSAFVLGVLLLVFQESFFIGLLLLACVLTACAIIWQLGSFNIPKLGTEIDLKKWLYSLVVVTCGWVIMGFGFFLLASSLEQNSNLFHALAANSLATGTGIVAVFAPGGIGIRELVFTYLGFASTTIIIWRFSTFIVDILLGIWAGWLISRGRR